jgi:hypothetical protein
MAIRKPSFSPDYYDNVGQYKICNRIVPGWFYQIFPYQRQRTQTPWFFTYYPESPCKLCDKGIFVRTPAKQGNNHFFRIPELSIWKWQYVELGRDADDYGLPLGISFTEGKAKNLPKLAVQILFHIIQNYSNENVITQEEAIILSKNKETESPKRHIRRIYTRSYTLINENRSFNVKYWIRKDKEERKKQLTMKRRRIRRKLKEHKKLKETRLKGEDYGHLQQDCVFKSG